MQVFRCVFEKNIGFTFSYRSIPSIHPSSPLVTPFIPFHPFPLLLFIPFISSPFIFFPSFLFLSHRLRFLVSSRFPGKTLQEPLIFHFPVRR